MEGSGQNSPPLPNHARPSSGSLGSPASRTSSGSTSARRNRSLDAASSFKSSLPAGRSFSIQIGQELFRLSGASIMSDGQKAFQSLSKPATADGPVAPSYFSRYFEEQLNQSEEGSHALRTLYIDRDPIIFQDIARHLQGYYILPRNGSHYVRLFTDAQFYSLPRLIKQLFDSEIFIQIGDQDFQIPRDIFSAPGNSPNFFSLGFAVFFNSPEEVFPGLERAGLLRPPATLPPSVRGRSARVFQEILHLLRGYPLHIRNSEHRAELIRDCRYFHLRGLEQKLIQHEHSFNAFRQTSEIFIRLEDLRQSGVSFATDVASGATAVPSGWVRYARPFADEQSHELVVEICEGTHIDVESRRAHFTGQVKARIASLFQVIANKLNLSSELPLGLAMSNGNLPSQTTSPSNSPLSAEWVRVSASSEASVTLDGQALSAEAMESLPFSEESESLASVSMPTRKAASLVTPLSAPAHGASLSRKRRRVNEDEQVVSQWVVRRGQWRIRAQPQPDQVGVKSESPRMEVVLHAVKLDAVTNQHARNTQRNFLSDHG